MIRNMVFANGSVTCYLKYYKLLGSTFLEYCKQNNSFGEYRESIMISI